MMVNAGLRAISDGCKLLKTLNIKNARLVTDVGVKHVGQGCKELTSLDLTGAGVCVYIWRADGVTDLPHPTEGLPPAPLGPVGPRGSGVRVPNLCD